MSNAEAIPSSTRHSARAWSRSVGQLAAPGRKLPGPMITGTAFLRNPRYHLPTERVDTLDYERMAAVVRALEHTIRGVWPTAE